MTKTTQPNINMSLDFETARHLKFQQGIDKHRNGDKSKGFTGELCNEAWQECLDLYSYLEQMESRDGTDLNYRKANVKALAEDIRKIHMRHIEEGI